MWALHFEVGAKADQIALTVSAAIRQGSGRL